MRPRTNSDPVRGLRAGTLQGPPGQGLTRGAARPLPDPAAQGLPAIAQFLERANAIADAWEAWAEQQVRAVDFELGPALPVGAAG